VLTEFSLAYPEDVDYIETPHAMVPIVQTVDLTLIESHRVGIAGRGAAAAKVTDDTITGASEADISGNGGEFNLGQFKAGQLPGY